MNAIVPSKPLFVGARSPDPSRPLWPRPWNSAGHRLAILVREAVGWEFEDYCDRIDRVDFCDGPTVNIDLARKRLAHIRAMTQGRRVVCIGEIPATLLGAPHGHEGWFVWDGIMGAMPSPNALNRFYNDAANTERAIQFLKEALS